MGKSHGWDLESMKNYKTNDESRWRAERIAEYNKRRDAIYDNPCSKYRFVELSNLAVEFEDLVDENGESPVEDLLEYLD